MDCVRGSHPHPPDGHGRARGLGTFPTAQRLARLAGPPLRESTVAPAFPQVRVVLCDLTQLRQTICEVYYRYLFPHVRLGTVPPPPEDGRAESTRNAQAEMMRGGGLKRALGSPGAGGSNKAPRTGETAEEARASSLELCCVGVRGLSPSVAHHLACSCTHSLGDARGTTRARARRCR